MSENFEPNIVAFLCNWCSYAGADLAGHQQDQVPCQPQCDPGHVQRQGEPPFRGQCLQQGADGVLVSGCHPGDCHYMEGNFYARRRFSLMKELLEYVGVDPRRFQYELGFRL
jgi:F420-non-reducing hydrogenase iron-sulfur subunit